MHVIEITTQFRSGNSVASHLVRRPRVSPASLGARQRDANEQHKEDEHHPSAYPIPPANPAQMMASFNAIALLATNKPATSKAAGDVRFQKQSCSSVGATASAKIHLA